MVRPGGILAAFGITGGEDVMRLHPAELVLEERRIVGSCAGFGNGWTDAMALLQYECIDPRPLFPMAVPLEELEQALRENKELSKVFVSPELSRREMLSK